MYKNYFFNQILITISLKFVWFDKRKMLDKNRKKNQREFDTATQRILRCLRLVLSGYARVGYQYSGASLTVKSRMPSGQAKIEKDSSRDGHENQKGSSKANQRWFPRHFRIPSVVS